MLRTYSGRNIKTTRSGFGVNRQVPVFAQRRQDQLQNLTSLIRTCVSGRSHSITYKYIQEWAVNNSSLKNVFNSRMPLLPKGTVLDLILRVDTAAPRIHYNLCMHINVQSTTCSSQPAVGHSVCQLHIRASPIVSVLLVVFDFRKSSPLPCIHRLVCFLRRLCLLSVCCFLSVGSICFPCGVSACSVFSANRPVYIYPSCHPLVTTNQTVCPHPG